MKPSVQKIVAKLAKEQEKKVEKVELSLVDDLAKYEKELERGIDELMQFATDAREAIGKGKREMDRLDAVYKVAQRISDDVEQSAKDLGVDIPQVQQVKKNDKCLRATKKVFIASFEIKKHNKLNSNLLYNI